MLLLPLMCSCCSYCSCRLELFKCPHVALLEFVKCMYFFEVLSPPWLANIDNLL